MNTRRISFCSSWIVLERPDFIYIATFVFFDNGVQKFSRLYNFSLCLWSQLENVVKQNGAISPEMKARQPSRQTHFLIVTFIL